MKPGKKSSHSAQIYLAWGGWFVRKEDSPDVYAQLPPWWRKQKDIIHERISAGMPPPSLEELEALRDPVVKDYSLNLPRDVTLRAMKAWLAAGGPMKDLLTNLSLG